MAIPVSPDSVFDSYFARGIARMKIDDSADDSPMGVPIPTPPRKRFARSPATARAAHGSVDAHGNTALIQAVMSASRAAVERCLAMGSDIDAQNMQGQTALFVACAGGHAEIAEALLLRRANPNVATLDGTVPLHAAAAEDNDRLVALLLDHGADPNARDDEGESPLHWAAREGSRRVASVLLKRGALATLANEDGETAYDVDPAVLLFGSVPDAAEMVSPQSIFCFPAQQQQQQPPPGLFNYSASAPCSMLSTALAQQSPLQCLPGRLCMPPSAPPHPQQPAHRGPQSF